jgi:hypothetical protein
MDKENKEKLELTPEEQTAEAEALKEVPDADLKAKVAEEFGIDPETDVELLEKLVQKEKANRERLSTAIKQKIKYRELSKKLPVKKDDKETPDTSTLIDQKVTERLEARDLEDLNLPNDEIKTEVKELAKLKGISVREAAKLPYIINKIAEVEKEQRILNASPKRSGKGGSVLTYDPTKPLDPADFRLDTPEGQKAWAEAKAARRKQGA